MRAVPPAALDLHG